MAWKLLCIRLSARTAHHNAISVGTEKVYNVGAKYSGVFSQAFGQDHGLVGPLQGHHNLRKKGGMIAR
jgi:hypothetical protein